jgi:hypothetical protein
VPAATPATLPTTLPTAPPATLPATPPTPTRPAPEAAPSSLFAPAPAAAPVVPEIVPSLSAHDPAPTQPAGPAEATGSAAASPLTAPIDPVQPPRIGLQPERVDSTGPALAEVAEVPGPRTAARTAPGLAPAALPPASAAAQSLRERSVMASQALSELSALSSYRPDGRSGTSAPGEESLGARRGTRNAADVRSMLSGFRAADERGHATTAPSTSVPEQAPVREQA